MLGLLWDANIAATVWLLYRLLAHGLARTYRILFLYFALDTVQQLAGVAVQNILTGRAAKTSYFYVYTSGQFLKLILAVFVVLELCQRTLASHPALAKFARRAAGGVLLGIGVAIGAVMALHPPQVPRGRHPVLHYWIAFESGMDIGILVFLLVNSAFLLWFPVRVRRNAAYYLGGFSVYFLARYVGLIWVNAQPVLTDAISVVELSIQLTCLVAMGLLLRKENEQNTFQTGPRDASRLGRLSHQLDEINAVLVRSAK